MDIEKIFEETDFPINDKVLASADFGDLSSELDEPFDGVLRGTFSCDKCDSVFTHRRSLERHRISIHTTSALFHCKICKKRFNRKDNFVRHSKIHKLTPIIMKLSRTANGEENSSANTSSEAAPGPSTATETTLSDHGRTSISTAPSRKRTVSPTRNACLDTFEVYTFFPDTSTSKDLTVITSCNEFENRGSGWEFQDVLKNELKIAIYKPLAAASYIPLPPKLIKKKAILNIRNEDQHCFLWCVLAHLHPAQANANRVSTYLKFQNELCTKNLTFPTPLNQIECFEEKKKNIN
ncbi:uncharacterized protein TNCV_5000021 [Trichonephila clavipes]|nr:uncharacterized protein TNCV_5000021 [Trichonephila clavipes]